MDLLYHVAQFAVMHKDPCMSCNKAFSSLQIVSYFTQKTGFILFDECSEEKESSQS